MWESKEHHRQQRVYVLSRTQTTPRGSFTLQVLHQCTRHSTETPQLLREHRRKLWKANEWQPKSFLQHLAGETSLLWLTQDSAMSLGHTLVQSNNLIHVVTAVTAP